MIRTKIKTNPMPRITGAEAEFYNPYEHHKQNLNNKILFRKDIPSFWDEERSMFWNPLLIKLPKKPAVPKSRVLENKPIPELDWDLSPATIFGEFSIQKSWETNQDGCLLHVTDETRHQTWVHDAAEVDLIRTKHPGARPSICRKTGMMGFHVGAELVGVTVAQLTELTDYQKEEIVRLGFDKQYSIDIEEGEEL